jgi:hypothetical protein
VQLDVGTGWVPLDNVGADSTMQGVGNSLDVANAYKQIAVESPKVVDPLLNDFRRVAFGAGNFGLRLLSDWQSLMVNLGLSKSVRSCLKSIDQLSATIGKPVDDMLLY